MFSIISLVTLLMSSLYVLGAPAPAPSLVDGVAPIEHSSNSTTFDKRVTHVGRATWFHAGLGNCGYWDNDDAPIVAVSTAMYKQGGNCNQWVELTNTENGKKVYAKMRDSCPPCGYDDVGKMNDCTAALVPRPC
ncbi:unnamed protein product [Rhizoctonia solani]|uniref:RlpA-like protein double-psi beta-barrel domain-containing protein n=1 Tax=Rhizoctonia solani TaxID=456999 RepID=A0A8H3ACW3_9AGAM|nr:unnamed protein product [Rhizoctonia solani]